MAPERYQRLELLGQGQMSVVWLAVDTYTQERVALKIMTAIHEDDRRNRHAQERFLREIEITRSLQHPHILPIRDHGYMEYEKRSVPYFVSPYMPEKSLADLSRKRPPWKYWSLEQTADAIMQAADCLWYLHNRAKPIVHQDVKPANFLYRPLQSTERAVYLYLCDFGIARWNAVSTAVASELLGTFAFMAPEQAERKINCASDQYALAVMACFLLTGKLPLQATTNELYVEAHRRESPIPPSVLNPERIASREIDEVILRALEKDPARRFLTIDAFARALQQAITKFTQKQANAITDKDTVTQIQTSLHNERRTLPVLSSVPRDPGMFIAIDPPEAREERILDEPLPVKPVKTALPVEKNAEVVFQLLPLQETARFALPARPKMLTWARDGSGFACVLYGHVPVYTRAEGIIQEINTAHAQQATCVCWSPDGRIMAVGGQGEIRFWDTTTQDALPLVLHTEVRSIEGLDWSANEQLAVWVDRQLQIYALPFAGLTSGQTVLPQTIGTGMMRSGNVGVLRWSPDGSLLVAGASNGQITCWSVGSLGGTWQVATAGQKVNSVAWSPDGTLLVAAFRDLRVAGWDTRTRKCVFSWEKLPAMPRMVSISPHRRISIASHEQRLLIGMPEDPFPLHIVPGQLLAAWSPTQEAILTLDEQKEHILTVETDFHV